MDWIESCGGVPKHILRLSVGLEDGKEILAVVERALKAVEDFERSVDGVVVQGGRGRSLPMSSDLVSEELVECQAREGLLSNCPRVRYPIKRRLLISTA
jgi:hypothetical protein